MSTAEVTEIVICACTGQMLEDMATRSFRSTQRVPDGFRCPCGHAHLLAPGIEKRDRMKAS